MDTNEYPNWRRVDLWFNIKIVEWDDLLWAGKSCTPITDCHQRRASVGVFVVCILATIAASFSISMDLRRILEPFKWNASKTSVNNAKVTQTSLRKSAFKTLPGHTNEKNNCVSFVNQSQCRNYSDAWWLQSFHLRWSKSRPNKILHNFAYSLCYACAGCQSWSKQNWYYMEFGRCLPFAVTWRHHDRDDSVRPIQFEYHVNTLVNSCIDALVAAHASCCLRPLSWRIFRIFTRIVAIFNGLSDDPDLIFRLYYFGISVESIKSSEWMPAHYRHDAFVTAIHETDLGMRWWWCSVIRLVVKNWNTENAWTNKPIQHAWIDWEYESENLWKIERTTLLVSHSSISHGFAFCSKGITSLRYCQRYMGPLGDCV